jgi:hypothetical protein
VAAVEGVAEHRRESVLDRSSVRGFVRRVVRIEEHETDLRVRGFAPCASSVRELLELHGRSFSVGFNSAIALPDLDRLAASLTDIEVAERGFAYEGAGMALALLDIVRPERNRIGHFLRRHGDPYVYLVHVGAGWALARLRLRPWARLRLDPLLRWLSVDGYGFHDAFFRPAKVVRRQAVPSRLRGYTVRAYDQGIGRALWFVDAADPVRVAATVAAYAPERRADLWSGVALAAAYAGGLDRPGYERLAELGREHAAHLAQGVAFAAAARLRAQHVPEPTSVACEVLCGVDVRRAAASTDAALSEVVRDGSAEAYESWRAGIRRRLAA